MSQQYDKLLKIISATLANHKATIAAVIEGLGDTALVSLSSCIKCCHKDEEDDYCNTAATQLSLSRGHMMCDRHLAELIASGTEEEDDWDDIEHAESIRNLSEYVDSKNEHNRTFTLQ